MTFLPNENSRASLLLDYVEQHLVDVGDTVTYEEVFDICQIEDTEKLAMAGTYLSSVVDTVNKRLHRQGDWRHLQSVERVGYKIGSPETIRVEVISRHRQMIGMQVRALRATEKVIRHPTATAAERKRAADAAASQAAYLDMMRRHKRRLVDAWQPEETSPVDAE